jgi:hypothetical protein
MISLIFIMFILSRNSSAYGDSRPQLIKAETISDACKKVLQARENIPDRIKDVLTYEYFLFDITGIVMTTDEERVYFNFPQASIESIDAFHSYFRKYLEDKETLSMTYDEFVSHISDLKTYLVDEGCTDDPFVSYEWDLRPGLGLGPDSEYLYRVVPVDDDLRIRSDRAYYSCNREQIDPDWNEIHTFKFKELEIY